MLGPSGKPFQSVSETLPTGTCVCGGVALIQRGILCEDLFLCRHPIGRFIDIQFIAEGDHLDPKLHLGVNRLAILAGSLIYAPSVNGGRYDNDSGHQFNPKFSAVYPKQGS
jgi:hypothetical protein